ncbi:MAG: MobC family plasmid mobilization relaxosome protein [Clostridium sp.]|nr:MobC family plasmid mobilization relaxosome protein [Clostridium sp.]
MSEKNKNIKENKYSFRVNNKDYEKIEKNIKKSKLSITEYMTKSALNREIVVIDNLKELVIEVNKIGVNINQLTKLANQGKVDCASELEEINKELVEAWQLLRQLIQRQA